MLLVQTAALTACAVLAGLAVFQAALLAGAPLGRFAWGGQHNVLPHGLRVGSAVSIVLYAAFGYAALAKANMVPPLGDETVTSVIAWVLTGYFVLGVLMNAISRSKPERTVMTPVALLLPSPTWFSPSTDLPADSPPEPCVKGTPAVGQNGKHDPYDVRLHPPWPD